jgi:hypothetical protein
MDGLTMGRFATTVTLYGKLRPPYPAAFFRNVAQRLRLGKEHALIDLGTGPGLLALGFAPYVAGSSASIRNRVCSPQQKRRPPTPQRPSP